MQRATVNSQERGVYWAVQEFKIFTFAMCAINFKWHSELRVLINSAHPACYELVVGICVLFLCGYPWLNWIGPFPFASQAALI